MIINACLDQLLHKFWDEQQVPDCFIKACPETHLETSILQSNTEILKVLGLLWKEGRIS